MAEFPTQGVLFAREDHAGVFRRFFIVAVDLSVLLGVAVGFGFLHDTFPDQAWAGERMLGWAWVALAWFYLVPLEAGVGTVGFLMAGVRITTVRGARPTLWRMTFRLLLLLAFGPLTALFDLLFLCGDPFRQTFRDKLAGTLVVRRSAPCSPGRIVLKRLTLLGFSFSAWEVEPAPEA